MGIFKVGGAGGKRKEVISHLEGGVKSTLKSVSGQSKDGKKNLREKLNLVKKAMKRR